MFNSNYLNVLLHEKKINRIVNYVKGYNEQQQQHLNDKPFFSMLPCPKLIWLNSLQMVIKKVQLNQSSKPVLCSPEVRLIGNRP